MLGTCRRSACVRDTERLRQVGSVKLVDVEQAADAVASDVHESETQRALSARTVGNGFGRPGLPLLRLPR